MEKNYTRFEINGKEYELIFGFDAVNLIGKTTGSLEFLNKTMQGDMDTFVDVIYLGLLHTEQGITRKEIAVQIKNQFEAEELDMDEILKYNKAVVHNSFFFKKMLKKMTSNMTEQEKEAVANLYS